MQRIAFVARPILHDCLIADLIDKAFENRAAKALTRHFATAKEDRALDLVAFVEESEHVVLLRLVIVLVNVDAELNFLDDDLLLVLLGLAFLLFLLIKVLAEVKNAANRWLRSRRNLYQVETSFPGHFERFERRHDAELIRLVVDHSDLAGANTLIRANETLVDTILR